MNKMLMTFVCAGMAIAANAQKLPGVQQGSVRAPADIKIDGKTTEWNGQFQAFNHATDIFYTMSNDDENLYLTVQATDAAVVRKILRGGVCLTIQPTGKKTDKDGLSVTYPVAATSGVKAGISVMSFKREAGGDVVRISTTEAATPEKSADSVMMARNAAFSKSSKWIGVTGFKGIDSLISVYNEDGIKAMGRYDNKGAFTYELAISLKQLGFSTTNPVKFTYHIALNGVNLFAKAGGNQEMRVVNVSGAPMGGGGADLSQLKIMLDQSQTAATDFWGEYMLAKK